MKPRVSTYTEFPILDSTVYCNVWVNIPLGRESLAIRADHIVQISTKGNDIFVKLENEEILVRCKDDLEREDLYICLLRQLRNEK